MPSSARPVRSLADSHPDLVAQWHPDNDLSPDQVTAGSHKKVRWRHPAPADHPDCEWHEWEARVDHRTDGSGCPFCAGKDTCPSNNLADSHPDLVAQWHPDNDLSPDQVTAGSNKKVRWRHPAPTDHPDCEWHEWEARVKDRTEGRGCPFCAGRNACPSNNLADSHPDLVAQWHPDNDLSPDQVKTSSGTKVRWRHPAPDDHPDCEWHEWEAKVANRTEGSGCPFCAGRIACPSNNLADSHPDLVAQWHPDNDLSPDQVTAGSHKKVRWRHPAPADHPDCEWHEWEATIYDRTDGSGCPDCAVSGFKPDRPAVLYLLSNVDAGLGKVGITNVDADTAESYRLDFFRRHGWAVEAVWYFPVGSTAYRTEQELLLWVRARHPSFAVTREGAPGGSGWTEMFPSSDLEAVRCRLLAELGTPAVPFGTEQAA